MNMMTGYSLLPLQLATMVGFLFTLFGILVLFFVLGRYLIEGATVQGFPFLASIIAGTAGLAILWHRHEGVTPEVPDEHHTLAEPT